ncbi:MAG: molybdopterin-dependent oxidoreductase [Firmicutes bacterium]|nr:molybdopterin-dependent oxidoreductase [Bacillota bacterium]
MPSLPVHGVCPHDCYDACSVWVTATNGRIVRIEGDPHHPLTRGFLCYKVNRYLDRLYHPERLKRPLKRVGPKGLGAFREVTWDEALREVASRLGEIMAKAGGEAVLPYSFSGNMGILSESSMDRRFFHYLGASQLERTICSAAADAALTWVYGTRMGPDPETLGRARLVVLWGSNPMVTNIHEIPLLDEARAHGAHIWTIDPLKTETATRYGRHVALWPHSDYALALGLARAIIHRGAHDQAFIDRYTRGFDAFQAVAEAWPRDRVLLATGLTAQVFEALVDDLIALRPLLIRTGYGVQRQFDGAKTVWALSCLSIILGAPQDVGGGHLVSNSGSFSINWERLTRPDLRPRETRHINMVQLGTALTAVDSPRVEALVVYNSNPAATAPDQRQVLEGLLRSDLLTIVHEQMMTDTARYADWVFPAAMSFETLDLFTSYWHRYLQLSVPATVPWGESVSNTEFFRRMAQALGLSHPALAASDRELIDDALDTPENRCQGLTWDRLWEEKVIKIGEETERRPFVDVPAPTVDGRLHLEPLPVNPEPRDMDREAGEWILLSPSRRRTIKSTFGNVASLVREDDPELLMHPDDLMALGVGDGSWVRVFNDRGETRMKVRQSERPQPGVVVSYAVRWNLIGDGGNVNQLTSAALSDFGGGATFYSTRVRIEL